VITLTSKVFIRKLFINTLRLRSQCFYKKLWISFFYERGPEGKEANSLELKHSNC